MVLRLETLRLTNFKTYQDSTFTFTPGHNVILGENGAGKSSIFEAITFALFGSVPGKTISSLIRHDQTRMEITLDFSVNDESFTVERTATRSSSNALLTEKDGKRIAEKSKAVNYELEKKLNIGQRVFSNVVYIPQGQISAIASERPSERKELFDKILGYYLYKKTSNRLRVIEKSTDQSLIAINERLRDIMEDIAKKKQIEQDLKELENNMVSLQKDLVEIEPKLHNVVDKFEKMDNEREIINQIQERVRTRENEIQKRQESLIKTKKLLEESLRKSVPDTTEGILDLRKELELQLNHLELTVEKTDTKVQKGKKIENTLVELNKQLKIVNSQNVKLKQRIEVLMSQVKYHAEKMKEHLIRLETDISKLSQEKDSFKKHLEKEIEKDKQKSIILERKKHLEIESRKQSQKITHIEENLSKIVHNWRDEIDDFIQRNIGSEKAECLKKIKLKQERLTEVLSTLESLKDQRIREREILRVIKTSKEKLCPLCGQEMEHFHIQKIVKEKKALLLRINSQGQSYTNEEKKLVNEIAKLEEGYDELEHEEKKQILIKKLAEDRLELENQIVKSVKEIKSLKKQENRLGHTRSIIQELKNKIAQNENSNLEISEKIKVVENIELLEEQLKEGQTRLDAINNEIKQKENDFDFLELEENIHVLNLQKNDQKLLLKTLPRIDSIINDREAYEKAVEQKNATLVELNSLKDDFDDQIYMELKDKVEKLKRKKIEKETQIKSIIKQQIPDKRKQLKEIEKKEQKLKEIKNDQKASRKKLDTIRLVREFTKNIVPLLRRQHVLAISEYSSEIFSYLMNNDEYEGIEITDDYELQILQSGRKYDLTILSGGEQVIACLAIRLAIAKLLANQDLMLLDEPTVMLDTYRRKELVEVFDRTKPVRQTIIVTHDTEFERVADTTFTIIKRAGKARVIAEEIDHLVSQQKKYQILTQERFSQLEIH